MFQATNQYIYIYILPCACYSTHMWWQCPPVGKLPFRAQSPQNGAHKSLGHFLHPEGAEKKILYEMRLSMRIWKDWMCTKWFNQPPNAISVQSGNC